MQNLNERGAAYIPIAKVKGITPYSDKQSVFSNAQKKTHKQMRRSGNVLS